MWTIQTGKDGWPYIRMENGEIKWQHATWRNSSISEEKKFLQSIIDAREHCANIAKEKERLEKEKLDAIPSQ